MGKKKILINNLHPQAGLKDLYSEFEVIAPTIAPFTRQGVLDLIKDCHGFLPAFFTVDKEILDAGVNLEMISNFGAGYDNVDIAYATKRRVVVTNIPDSVTQATAELTMGLILSLVRRITEGDRRLRKGSHADWGKTLGFLGATLAGKTLGIVGMGRIGLATAKLAQAFGMQVIYNKRKPYSQEKEQQYALEYANLNKLLETADIVSVHCPLTPDTHHLISRAELEIMKPSAVIINTGRGPVVREKDLLLALKAKQIAGAALDVFEFEPEISEELLSLENVLVTPHIGSSTLETRTEMTKACVKHLIDYFSGKRPTQVVNPETLASG